MPIFGLGLYQVPPSDDTTTLIVTALKQGYRLLDGAFYYHNDQQIRAAIARSNVPRSEIFITHKIFNFQRNFTYEQAQAQIEQILVDLGTDYIDLLLVHWPAPSALVTYRAIEAAYRAKKVRAIGVSNFTQPQLQALLQEVDILPTVNQVQFSPDVNQQALLAFCESNGIHVNGWRPLGMNILHHEPVIAKIAHKHHVSEAQVCIRWSLQQGLITIPKTVHTARLAENANVDGFTLDDTDLAAIKQIKQKPSYWPFNWFHKDQINWH